MTEVTLLASEITARYGTIKRARGSFLYTSKGVRLTDLFLEGGRAVLGWGGGSAFTVFKNVLNRGITGSYDTDFSSFSDSSKRGRLDKAVSELLAGNRTVKIFTSKKSALQAAISFSAESTSFWRPWNQEDTDWRNVKSVIIEPPLPWTDSLWLLALSVPEISSEKNEGAKNTEKAAALEVETAFALDKANDILESRIPAPLEAAVTRSIYDMIAALQVREEKDWFIYDTVVTKYWTRKGPYLIPKISREKYGDFLLHCLDCGIVISPIYEQPSIVPFGADFGVFRSLQKSPFNIAD